ncbi:MAG: hypothetical protein QOG02_2113 [Gaiellales bacterium]|nr:hypothetical protein [Gaiellales bacterium]MDX6546339.1 hypothetical protein [Gaiellales bacterium]
MATVSETVDVNAPVHVAYNQWTQFEQFPMFMEGVEQVSQLDDTHLHWVAQIGGKRHEWDAEITEQQPNQRIAWHSTSGHQNAGEVVFEQVEPGVTRVKVQFHHETEGLVEMIGSAIGADDRQVQDDLLRYKELVERQGGSAEGWQGEVHNGQTQHTGTADGPQSV